VKSGIIENCGHGWTRGVGCSICHPIPKLSKPDAVFVVRVHPTYRIVHCAEYNAQEQRGLFGCHDWKHCPQCQVIDNGFQMWGENGHCQASGFNRDQMRNWIKIKAREQWPQREPYTLRVIGRYGYRFRAGSPLYYVG
jgi:Zn ribbon nucleic-acid-binding protein